MSARRTSRRVRVRLDFVIDFDRDLDSLRGPSESAIEEGVLTMCRMTPGARGFAPGMLVQINLDARKGGA